MIVSYLSCKTGIQISRFVWFFFALEAELKKWINKTRFQTNIFHFLENNGRQLAFTAFFFFFNTGVILGIHYGCVQSPTESGGQVFPDQPCLTIRDFCVTNIYSNASIKKPEHNKHKAKQTLFPMSSEKLILHEINVNINISFYNN